MKPSAAVLGERYTSKAGAIFDSLDEAQRAQQAAIAEAGLEPDQARLIRPGDARGSQRVEPRSFGVGLTLIKAHLTLGGIGALVGLVTASLLLLSGVRAFTSSPAFTVGLITAIGTVAGLLLGGLVSLRPDRDVVDKRIEDAIATGEHWVIVVYARDHGQERRAIAALERLGGKIMASL